MIDHHVLQNYIMYVYYYSLVMKGIEILGAGLSGLTSAINLAKAGYKVDIYEKNKDVGMRFCGDIQALENWSEKKDVLEELGEAGLVINFDCDPFSRIILTNGPRTKPMDSEKPWYYLVKRGSSLGTIDYGLKEQALELGAKIHFEKTIQPNEADIVATGPVFQEVFAVAKGIVFRTHAEDIAVTVFNDKLAFRGYSYLLVTKGYGCMCTVVVADELRRIDECLRKTHEFFEGRINLDMHFPRQVGGIGSFSLRNTFKRGKTLYVGEAAGLQDFLWGYGVRFAIRSGYFAAQSIVKNEDYETIARERFRNKLRASVVNRYLWEDVVSKKNYSIVFDIPVLFQKILHSMHRYNLLQRIIYPLALSSLKRKYPNLESLGTI